MTGAALHISASGLVVALVFVLVAQGCSLVWKLGLTRDLAVGTLRTFAQLYLMGYALKIIFRLDMGLVSVAVFAVMAAAAAHIIRGRVGNRGVPYVMPMFLSMLIGYFAVAAIVTGAVIGSDPWWKPEYFIPIAGMVIGNSMSALAIALERLFSDLAAKRDEVEMRLCLGADFREASREITADAVKAGMIPSINSMMGVGIVFIPGMMTGQILSGVDPLVAVRYQIVVMLMLVASSALGTVASVLLARARCFGASQELIVKR